MFYGLKKYNKQDNHIKGWHHFS